MGTAMVPFSICAGCYVMGPIGLYPWLESDLCKSDAEHGTWSERCHAQCWNQFCYMAYDPSTGKLVELTGTSSLESFLQELTMFEPLTL